MAIKQIGFANISGLAADTKPTAGIGAGSTFYETDTKKNFIYDGAAWNESGGSGALFQFNYQWKLAVDTSPPTRYMSRDNATTASITKLYVNKVDATGHDMSLFLSEITAGDDLTLHDHNDADIYIVFTVSAAVTLTGNAFTIPVTFVKQNGADFTDNESVNIHWVSESKSVTAPSGLEKITEGGHTGWRLIGTDITNALDIGDNAIDLLTSHPLPSGASGDNSLTVGVGGTASGINSVAIGSWNVASGIDSFVGGHSGPAGKNHAVGTSSFSFQNSAGSSYIKGTSSVVLGGINNQTEVSAVNSAVIGGNHQMAVQPNMVYLMGTKYKSYTTVEIAALPDSELGTFLFDSTLNSLVQCTDATVGANVWKVIMTEEQVKALFGNFTFNGDDLKNAGENVLTYNKSSTPERGGAFLKGGRVILDMNGFARRVLLNTDSADSDNRAQLTMLTGSQAALYLIVAGVIRGINIGPTYIDIAGLTIDQIDAGGVNSAVTKEWVEGKFGNYSFDGDVLKSGILSIIEVEGTHTISINPADEIQDVEIRGTSITIDLTIAQIESGSLKSALTKEWVESKITEKGGIAHSATTDYEIGDIVTEAGKVYSCKTAHTAHVFNAAEWDGVGVASQTQPTAPPDLSGTMLLTEMQAVLDYSKQISADLKAAGIYK